MNRRLITAGAVALLVLGALLAALWHAQRDRSAETPAAPGVATSPPARVDAPPARPVPAELRAVHAEIGAARHRGDLGEAIRLYPRLIQGLADAWGAENRDLAPYLYNFALTSKLVGDTARCLTVARQANALWPGNLQLEVLEAATRAESAIAGRRGDAEAERLFEFVLRDENLPRLRGYRVAPPSLLGQWARLVFNAGRTDEALGIAERGLALDPDHRACLEVKVDALRVLRRHAEAIPLLRSLLASGGSTPRLEIALALSELATGAASDALPRLEKLLERIDDGELELDAASLRLHAARALNELGRFREAAARLLGSLSERPFDLEATQELARSARGLGATGALEPLNARVRVLLGVQGHASARDRSRRVGNATSELYYQALVDSDLERPGHALAGLDEARRLSANVEVELERARVLERLGRDDLAAASLEAAWRRTRSPIVRADLARVLARLSRRERAIALLESAEVTAPSPDSVRGALHWGQTEASLLVTRGARARLELGDIEIARELAARALATGENADEALLAASEAALRSGDIDGARGRLTASFREQPGAAAWAGALRMAIDLCRAPDSGSAAGLDISSLDPSDLLDHPRLLEATTSLIDTGSRGASGLAATEWLARLRVADSRRRAIVGGLTDAGDQDVATAFRELLVVFREVAAVRKARETAWYVAHLEPRSMPALRSLLEVLDAPSDFPSRLSILDRALELDPGAADLATERARLRALVGL